MLYRYMLAVITGVFSAMSISALHKRETDPVQILPGYREGKDIRNPSILVDQHMWHLVFIFITLTMLKKTRESTLRLFWTTIME